MRTRVCGRDPAVELSGDWSFATDLDDEGLDAGWADPGAPLPDARTVSVPHAWQEDAESRDYAGVAWYERTFEAPGLADGERAFVRFGAVDWEATVFCNGQRVGRERDGYLPFALEVTDALRAGENTLTLRVFDPDDVAEIPHGKQGEPWYTPVSGPWQRVDCFVLEECHVTDLRVTPDLDRDAAVVEVATSAPDRAVEATVAVAREGETVAAETRTLAAGAREATVDLSLPDPDYWTPADPALYDVSVALEDGGAVVDERTDRFGMRSVAVEDGEWYLNGDPLFVRGALDQAIYPDTLYRPADVDHYATEVRTAKDLGFNLLRKHIKPAHPEFLRQADEQGLLVWEEPANPTVHSETSRRRVEDQAFGMLDRDYNRPSVVVWSLFNEEWGIGNPQGLAEETSLWDDAAKQDYLAGLYEDVRAADPTRLVCDNSGWAHVATDVNDYHEYFVLPDRADPWRERLADVAAAPAENYAAERTDPADAPLVVSEFGTWGLPDVERIEAHYGGDPHWFDHPFRRDTLAHPAGVRERFAGSHLSSAFADLGALADAWQRREFASVRAVVADMRASEAVSGYCLTEFSDVEWEFNGVLDGLRNQKGFADAFADANAPVAVFLDVDPVAWAGETITGDVVVVNDTAERLDATVSWAAAGDSGTAEVTVDPAGVTRLEDCVVAAAPSVDAVESVPVTARLPASDRTDERTVTVAPDAPPALGERPVYAAPALADALADRGYAVVEDAGDAAVAVCVDPEEAAAFAAEGGHAVLVPAADGHPAAAESGVVSYTALPERASWNLCASFLHQQLFDGLDAVPGWAFDGLYPYGYVDEVRDGDAVAVGYTEGWVHNTGAAALTRERGNGTLAVTTLRVTGAYGTHPVGTAVLDALLAAGDGDGDGGE